MKLPTFRLRTLMIAIEGIGLWLGLALAYPEVGAWLILLAIIAVPPAYLARRRLAQMKVQGESLSLEDRIALFLCMSLFTVPIVFLLLLGSLYLLAPFVIKGVD
jgi:hypothetical protein